MLSLALPLSRFVQKKPRYSLKKRGFKNGAAIGSRTPNLQIRSLALYPVELWLHEERRISEVLGVTSSRILTDFRMH